MAEGEDKSQAPTPHRRDQFRKQGQFARARDLTTIASVSAVIIVTSSNRERVANSMDLLLASTFGDLTAIGRGQFDSVVKMAGATLFILVVPTILAAASSSILAGVVQSGWHFYWDLIGFHPEKLNPIPRLQQLVKPKFQWKELAIATVRVGIIGWVAYKTLWPFIPQLLNLSKTQSLPEAYGQIREIILRVVWRVLLALTAFAVIDYGQSKFFLEREMRMSSKEVKDEAKAHDGDPATKGRIRTMGRELIRKVQLRMVKKATVVVTNPTHVSVALRYDTNDAAPVVLAKGHDDEALKIRSEARKHGIPIIESRALARALDAEVPIGHPIPQAHYAAVAQVLAFVYRIKGRTIRGMASASAP